MKNLFLFAFALLSAHLSRAQWEEDIRLTYSPDTSSLPYGMSDCIATSGDTVHVIWRDKMEGKKDVYYKHSTDGGSSWDQDIKITNDEPKQFYPSLALSGQVIHAVYGKWRDDGYSEIYYNRSVNGGESWGMESRLTDNISYYYESAVAASGSHVHVVWVNTDWTGFWQVFYKHSPDGGISWGPETCLTGYSYDAFNPSVAASGSDVYVVWNDDRDGYLDIYCRKSSSNGITWDPEKRLTYDQASSVWPSVAVSGSSAHIAWGDYRDGNFEIYYKGSVDGGSHWGQDIRITSQPADSYYPNLAVSNSVIHLVWNDLRNGFLDIFYNYSTDGGATWATDTQLNDISFSSKYPFIAVSDPVLHVIWQDYRDNNYEIYYKRNPTGGVPVAINENTGSISTFIYPNPANELLTVDSPQSSAGIHFDEYRLSVIDLFGRTVLDAGKVRAFPYQLRVSDLPDGVYFLRVIDEEGGSETVDFLKIAE